MLFPSRAQFCELAKQGNLIPIYREIIADLETPVSAYLKIDTGKHSFLFESAEHGNKFSRYSFLGVNPRVLFIARQGKITIQEKDTVKEFVTESDPLAELQKLMARYHPVPVEDLPIFFGGAVGYLA